MLSRTIGLILFAFFSVVLPSFGSEPHSASSGRIFVVLRFDDVGAGSKLEQLTPILSAMDAVGAPYTLGVIPSGISNAPKIVALLKRLANRDLDLAQHGLTHENCTGHGSEFRGLSRELQKDRIEKGIHIFEQTLGMRPTTFIPPWNSYDSVTLDVVESLNFTTFSGCISFKESHATW